MQNISKFRLQKEYDELLQQEEKTGIKVWQINSDLFHWKAIIKGPNDTPYDGGKFQIDMVFVDSYPFQPPKMKFDTKIWHPNISSQTGAICLDTLKDQWSPALSVRTALLSISALLCAPEPSDPQDAVVAKQYTTDNASYKKTAKEWTQEYASDKVYREKIKKLVDMGFTEENSKKALEKLNWDEEKALNELLK